MFNFRAIVAYPGSKQIFHDLSKQSNDDFITAWAELFYFALIFQFMFVTTPSSVPWPRLDTEIHEILWHNLILLVSWGGSIVLTEIMEGL